MRLLFSKNFWWYILLSLIVGIGSWYGSQYYIKSIRQTVETAVVKIANVERSITVSGKIEAREVARLSFPASGIIQDVYKREGAVVKKDEVIASLISDAVVAEYNAALESVRYAEQVRQQLVEGATREERAVAATDIDVARAALARTKTEYEQAIENARRALLSTELTPYPVSAINDDTPPTITGNYLCTEEGQYIVSVFGSNSISGYSYRLSGLGTGTFVAHTDTPQPLGSCGLFIQFAAGEIYRSGDWIIDVPNRRSASYVTLKNEYDRLVAEKNVAVKEAEEAVALASRTAESISAPPTRTALTQAMANVDTAKAQLLGQSAKVADYTIRAPFDGLISKVDMKIGETASPIHTITVVADGGYDLRARIPEIDITKINVGSRAHVTFDADRTQSYPATITFISPISINVSGVAYYESLVTLDQSPAWIREGLNADIVIESEQKQLVPTLPKQYLEKIHGQTFVLMENGAGSTEYIEIQTGLIGSDGTVEVLNLPVGTTVIRP